MSKRTLIQIGSTLGVFILFGLIGGIYLNTLLTSAAPLTPTSVAFAATSASPGDELAGDPVAVAPTTSAAPLPTPTPVAVAPTATPRPTVPPATPAPTPKADGKLIVVSLASQSLTFYQDGKIIATTVVATGRPALPTLTGTFHIKAKYSPYQFISPWPKSSPYWYASAWTNYAMLYDDGGYFIHDAPWRTVYGPGANLTNGTHGCVNVPYTTMAFLYKWASVGTTVQVQ
jgi:lipoprotein-anchoring transpeptidase ErfK/SrfK